MTRPRPEPVRFAVDAERSVSGLIDMPPAATACAVLAHGAGAGMTHPFLAAVAARLSERAVATLRYQFPYMEKKARRPDPPQVAHAAVRAAVQEAADRLPGLPLFAGGKSFGGRMTSQAQALAPLPGVSGLFFLGFPLHPAAKPSDDRAAHLFDIRLPMLFLQGDRDTLADLDLLRPIVRRLGEAATLKVIEGADHSFRLRKSDGRDGAEVVAGLAATIAEWLASVSGP